MMAIILLVSGCTNQPGVQFAKTVAESAKTNIPNTELPNVSEIGIKDCKEDVTCFYDSYLKCETAKYTQSFEDYCALTSGNMYKGQETCNYKILEKVGEKCKYEVKCVCGHEPEESAICYSLRKVGTVVLPEEC